jgi:hypothetical protein
MATNTLSHKMCGDHVLNPTARLGQVPVGLFAEEECQRVLDYCLSFPGYNPTPLLSLPGLAVELGVAQILKAVEALSDRSMEGRPKTRFDALQSA